MDCLSRRTVSMAVSTRTSNMSLGQSCLIPDFDSCYEGETFVSPSNLIASRKSLARPIRSKNRRAIRNAHALILSQFHNKCLLIAAACKSIASAFADYHLDPNPRWINRIAAFRPDFVTAITDHAVQVFQ